LQNFLQLIRLGIKNQKILITPLRHAFVEGLQKKQTTLWLQNIKKIKNMIKVIFVERGVCVDRMFVFYDVERRWIWTIFCHLFWILYDYNFVKFGFYIQYKGIKIQSGIIKKTENQNDVYFNRQPNSRMN
jgi:hypothetical protein